MFRTYIYMFVCVCVYTGQSRPSTWCETDRTCRGLIMCSYITDDGAGLDSRARHHLSTDPGQAERWTQPTTHTHSLLLKELCFDNANSIYAWRSNSYLFPFSILVQLDKDNKIRLRRYMMDLNPPKIKNPLSPPSLSYMFSLCVLCFESIQRICWRLLLPPLKLPYLHCWRGLSLSLSPPHPHPTSRFFN